MNIKPNDIIIENLAIKYNPTFNEDNIKKYFYYVIERHKIQLKKDSGQPFPWTEDKILQENSFTCNRRQDDKTSRWLIDRISNNENLSFADRVWRSLLFRCYNKMQTAELIKLDSVDFWDHIEEAADVLDSQKDDVYTRAFKTVSMKYVYKDRYPDRNWRSLRLLGFRDMYNEYKGQIPKGLLGTAQEAYDWLVDNIPGVGRFMGLQLFVDLTYINEIPYSNNWFVMAGPGAQVGMDRIFDDKDGMSYEDCLFYITLNFEELCRKYYDPDFSLDPIRESFNDPNVYCVTDIQNTFCETSKLFYLLENRHKNKRKYIYKEG